MLVQYCDSVVDGGLALNQHWMDMVAGTDAIRTYNAHQVPGIIFTVHLQTAVTADFTSKQLLLFVFARRSVCQYSMAEENPAARRQTAVTDYL